MITLHFQILSLFKKTKLMDCEMGSNFLDQQFCDKFDFSFDFRMGSVSIIISFYNFSFHNQSLAHEHWTSFFFLFFSVCTCIRGRAIMQWATYSWTQEFYDKKITTPECKATNSFYFSCSTLVWIWKTA
jgi:hypothetical protein